MQTPLILASRSPRRREMLENLGIELIVVPSDIEETLQSDEAPEVHALRLAWEKAMAVAGERPHDWVLAADTIVVVDGEILGKPGSPESVREMLRKLSGREHIVITAFSIMGEQGRHSFSDVVKSTVVFKELDDDEIEWYAASEEPYDKAGGYAIQGKAACFITEIRGSSTNVIGLPLAEVVATLKRMNILRFSSMREKLTCRP